MSAFTRVFPFCAFSLCLAIALLTTPVWGQTYVSGTLGLLDGDWESTDSGDDGTDGSGTVLGVEVGVEPGDSGFGYSLGYMQRPFGEETASTIDIGLKYEPGDGGLWYDISLGRTSIDEGVFDSATGLTASVYKDFEGIMASSAFVPYGGLGLSYSDFKLQNFDNCEIDSSIQPILEVGARRPMSSTAELKIGLAYNPISADLQCKYEEDDGSGTTRTVSTTTENEKNEILALISFKRTF